jgi:hypothetical protein
MDTSIFKGVPKRYNGDLVVGFASTQTVKDMGWADRSSLSAWFQEDTTKNYLGLVDLFTNFSSTKVPFMKGLLDKKAVLEVNGMDGRFTYDVPVYTPTGTYTMRDTSTESDFPGIDESYFPVVLSKPYRPGAVLGYDLQYGEQFIISNEHEVIPDGGDGWLHMAQLVGGDPTKYFPKEKLKAGIQYFKTGHNLAEYDTQFDNIESPDNMATMTCEFILGNHRGVETNYTMYADKKTMAGATTKTKDFLNYFVNEQSKIKDDMGRELNMFYMGNSNPATGKMRKETVTIGATLEYLVLLENIKLEAYQLLFQKGATMKTSNGIKRLNEGAWHQFRRGKKISYSRPGGITREHLRQAAAYVFQGREDLLPEEREMTFDAGQGAYMNLMEIFREEFHSQLSGLSLFMGTERSIPNPVSGTLDGLSLAAVKLRKVFIPGLGHIEVRYDPSLNYQAQSDRFSRGIHGQGFAKDSYSLIIRDAASSDYSNARQNLPSGTTLISGGNDKSNVYFVKPTGDSMWWGYEQGRWSPNKASDIISSSKTMSREFWVHSTSACWIQDVSKFLIIELRR